MICRRRLEHSALQACTDLYVEEITKEIDEACDGAATACVWKALFLVHIFNGREENLTYDWTVEMADGSHGATTPETHDQQEVVVWVTSQTDKFILLTCVVTDSSTGQTATLTSEFETRNEL